MQGPSGYLSVLTIPPGATSTQARIVIDGVRGAIFVYQAGAPLGNLVGSWAGSAGTDPYGNVYPEGFSGLLGVIQGTTFFVYAGTPAAGNLIGSWSGTAGTDAFGNTYPAGFSAFQGRLSGMQITSPVISGGSGSGLALTMCTINSSNWNQGNITESTIVFDSGGGKQLLYTTTTTVTTITTPGAFNVTPPVGVNSVRAQLWGASAGGGGGNSGAGGEAGGGAEYAEEPAYAVIGGQQYSGYVGVGGGGGTTGNAGNNGQASTFDGGNVFANPGLAGTGGVGGLGGTGSGNTIHFNGGTGGSNPSNFAGGASGGNSANPTAAGNNGLNPTGSSGAAAPAAQTGSGTGGAGGNTGANGSGGGAPGGAGGGAGEASGVTQGTLTYRFTNSASYFGPDANSGAPPEGRRDFGTMYQGGETASGGGFNGTMYSLGLLPSSVQSDLSGKTIDSVTMRFENLHSWYDSGMYLLMGYGNFTSLGSSYNGGGLTQLGQFWIDEGAETTFDLTSTGLGTALANGTATAISLGYNGQPAFDLWNYGYMYGAGGSNSQNPLLTIKYHTGSAPVTAGGGVHGQAIITWQSANVLVGSFAPLAGTDQYGNHYPAGLMSQAVTLLSGSAPPTPTLAAALFADSNGDLREITQGGLSAVVALGQSDTTTNTVTQTTATALTKSWSVTSADIGEVGRVFRLTAHGKATWGTTQEALSFEINAFGNTAVNLPIGALQFAASAAIAWKVVAEIIITATGSSGTANVSLHVTASLNAGSLLTGTGANGTFAGQVFQNGETVNTTATQPIQLLAFWASSTVGCTTTCYDSILERVR